MRNKIGIGLMLAASIFAVSCGGGSFFKKAEIQSVDWTISNYPGDYWLGVSAHSFYKFYIDFSPETNIGADDIKSASVYSTSGDWNWDLTPEEDFYSDSLGLHLESVYFYSSKDEGNSLPIGSMVAKIELMNGKTTSYPFKTTEPNSLDTPEYSFVSSEEVVSGAHAPNLVRPSVISVTADSTQDLAMVSFSMNDLRINNGFIWFYDAYDNYLGNSRRFFNSDASCFSGLNSGLGLVTNGLNLASFHAAEIFSDGTTPLASVASIAKARVVALDGNQFGEHGRYYSYRAISTLK